MLIEVIKTHALAAAQAGNWQSVAETLHAIAVTAEPRLCYAVESGTAVAEAGGDPTALLTVLLCDPNGMMLFQKLSSSAGVMWSHPATIPYLEALVTAGAMSETVKDALIDLSAPVTHPHVDVTTEQCKDAWDCDYTQAWWASQQNDGDINAAVAAGDLVRLKAALTAAAESL